MSNIINKIGFELSRLGYGGLSNWAREQGYKVSTTRNALYRWENRTKGLPRGRTAVILMKLTRLIDEPVSPALESYFKSKNLKGKPEK